MADTYSSRGVHGGVALRPWEWPVDLHAVLWPGAGCMNSCRSDGFCVDSAEGRVGCLGAWGSSLLIDRRMECDEVDRLMHLLSSMVGRLAGYWIFPVGCGVSPRATWVVGKRPRAEWLCRRSVGRVEFWRHVCKSRQPVAVVCPLGFLVCPRRCGASLKSWCVPPLGAQRGHTMPRRCIFASVNQSRNVCGNRSQVVGRGVSPRIVVCPPDCGVSPRLSSMLRFGDAVEGGFNVG